MNENEFVKSILQIVKEDKQIQDWYAKNLDGQDYADTIVKLDKATFQDDGLSTWQALVLAAFIGFSHNLAKETKREGGI